MKMKKAVVILSGGLDSATCMGIAKDEGYELYPITFHYGQRHSREVESAIKLSEYYDTRSHKVINLDWLRQIGGSSLTDISLDVPTSGLTDEIPNTYVPARNLIFIALATAYAEVISASALFLGVNSLDYSGYPDCRPEFIQSMSKTINLATKNGVTGMNIKIETPLINMTKAEIIKKGLELGVPYHLTTSCYQGKELACARCDSCRLRIKGFQENKIIDPIDYEKSIVWN
jgi:7-cyano-7-deazaguanine synthase